MRTLRQIQQEIRALIGRVDKKVDDPMKFQIIDTLEEIDTDIDEILENIEEIF